MDKDNRLEIDEFYKMFKEAEEELHCSMGFIRIYDAATDTYKCIESIKTYGNVILIEVKGEKDNGRSCRR